MSSFPSLRTKVAGSANGRSPSKFVFGFLDETGSVASSCDQYFAMGLLRTSEPHQLQRRIRYLRQRTKCSDEFKWSTPRSTRLSILEAVIDEFFASGATLSVLVADNSVFAAEKKPGEPGANSARHLKAYEHLARQLVQLSIRRGETMFLVADEYSSPPKASFEENIQSHVNKLRRRQALAGVCRMRSKGVDLLQVTDLLLGAIVHEYKQQSELLRNMNPRKSELLRYIKEKAAAESLLGDYRGEHLQVMNFHDFDFSNQQSSMSSAAIPATR